jgi:hypothetical protein
MADENKTGGQSHTRTDDGKPGSDPDAAKAVGGKGDFGIPVNRERTADRDYTSANTKASDPGAARPRSGEDDRRSSGAGAPSSGVGSSSGGDVDTDIIGVGTGGSSISQGGPSNRPPGPDDSDGTSDEFASGPRADGKRGSKYARIEGSVMQSPDDSSSGPGGGQGADAATNPAARGDDSFASEISSDEASGQDSSSSSDRD